MRSEKNQTSDIIEIENEEWIESLEEVYRRSGPERVRQLLELLRIYAQKRGVLFPYVVNTPYVNTIPVEEQPRYPGNLELERRIRSFVRWNAMAMVVRANKISDGIGGHISTYASAATLFEVAYNHFIKGEKEGQQSDIVYFQGHASPGVYARAFVEGIITEEHLKNFRREVSHSPALSSYPHPWLMPNFWEFPTVSMGLSPIMAIYQARFNRYLEDRGLIDKPLTTKVWAFIGDGETDEPEVRGAISLAAREKLDNLIFVVNCNLQRLDGPVRGNGKIIQELEAVFGGAGWNVIKVIWGSDWDPLLSADHTGKLVQRMEEAVDGDYQKYVVASGDYIRKHFFGKYPELLKLVEHYTDEELQKLKRGGHDPEKVYAAYKAAVEHKGAPTVILAKTVKGYGLGESGEGRNISHQQKKLNEQELREFRTRFSVPISDDMLPHAPFYKPPEDSPEMKYLRKLRRKMGNFVPSREIKAKPLNVINEDIFEEFYKGSEGKEVATTMAFVRMLARLLKDEEIGKLIVPIVPDEARTFGMDSLFRQVGIYSHIGQLYEPVDSDTLLYYKEAKDGQILEEGITEAGAMASFIAAGTAYATFGINTIPIYMFYSMFGLQRIGDLVWAAGDIRCKGFLVGGTSGRTTLPGEGLQHCDGNSHVYALAYPTLKAYDPAFAYEIAVIVLDGIKKMYHEQKDLIYYITIMNELYEQPPMPEGVKEGIIKGLYKYSTSSLKKPKGYAQLMGSGAILNEVIKAQKELEEHFGIAANVWSITSFKELYLDTTETERWNRLHPNKKTKKSYIEECMEKEKGVFVAASDYLRSLPLSISKWFPRPLHVLGTDGFGRSDDRKSLREFFEVDYRHIVLSTLYELYKENTVKESTVKDAIIRYEIDTEKEFPVYS